MAERHSGLPLWFRLSVDFESDPKLRRAGLDAELLYIRSLARMKRAGTDGHLSAEWWPDLLHGFRSTAATKAREALVREGLWEPCEDGWRIPNGRWARWQDTEEDRARERERKAEYRRKRKERGEPEG